MEHKDIPASVTVSCKPGTWDIFAYKMYHSFCCPAGVGRLLFSAAFIALGLGTAGMTEAYMTVIVLGIGLLNVVVTPVLYLVQASKAAGSSTTVTYLFTPDQITARDGSKRAGLSWKGLALVVWMRRRLLLYTSPREALVLPRRQMEGKDQELLALIRASADPARFVVRRIL